jgi:hemerythrin-like domain-containing protein
MLATHATSSPLARLRFEHRQIDRVLAAMAEVVVRTRTGAEPNHEFFTLVTEFIESYVDGRHHIKEEGALFEGLLAFGFSADGPIGCMVHQHQRGRELVHVIREWVDAEPHVRAIRLEEMLSAATQYVELLWHHIATEDNGIFPAAELALPEVLRLAVRTRSEELDPSPPEEFRAAADALVRLAERLSLESGPLLGPVARRAEL